MGRQVILGNLRDWYKGEPGRATRSPVHPLMDTVISSLLSLKFRASSMQDATGKYYEMRVNEISGLTGVE